MTHAPQLVTFVLILNESPEIILPALFTESMLLLAADKKEDVLRCNFLVTD